VVWGGRLWSELSADATMNHGHGGILATAGNSGTSAGPVGAMNAQSWALFGKAMVLLAAAITGYAALMRIMGF
jgi:hypothetical protein